MQQNKKTQTLQDNINQKAKIEDILPADGHLLPNVKKVIDAIRQMKNDAANAVKFSLRQPNEITTFYNLLKECSYKDLLQLLTVNPVVLCLQLKPANLMARDILTSHKPLQTIVIDQYMAKFKQVGDWDENFPQKLIKLSQVQKESLAHDLKNIALTTFSEGHFPLSEQDLTSQVVAICQNHGLLSVARSIPAIPFISAPETPERTEYKHTPIHNGSTRNAAYAIRNLVQSEPAVKTGGYVNTALDRAIDSIRNLMQIQKSKANPLVISK